MKKRSETKKRKHFFFTREEEEEEEEEEKEKETRMVAERGAHKKKRITNDIDSSSFPMREISNPLPEQYEPSLEVLHLDMNNLENQRKETVADLNKLKSDITSVEKTLIEVRSKITEVEVKIERNMEEYKEASTEEERLLGKEEKLRHTEKTPQHKEKKRWLKKRRKLLHVKVNRLLDIQKVWYDEKNKLLDKENKLLDEINKLLDKEKMLLDEKKKLDDAKEQIFQQKFDKMNPINVNVLCQPEDVEIILDECSPPEFVSAEWLDDTVKLISQNYKMKDGDADRIPPMALVRCSRGGKTRALKEIGFAFKHESNDEDVAVIYISFNGFSSVDAMDIIDPVRALCRRIAFAATKGAKNSLAFDKFKSTTDVTSDDITGWLGDTPCLLLIDELNNLKKLDRLSCWKFLKDNFLSIENRYFVFSSHISTITTAIKLHMDVSSNRDVIVQQLPLIPSAQAVITAFDKCGCHISAVSKRRMIYLGLIPAMIYLEAQHRLKRNDAKRALAIKKCIDDNLKDEKVIKLLSSFIDGNTESIPSPLLPLMSGVQGFENRVQWIPFHMHRVLAGFIEVESLSRNLRSVLKAIDHHFDTFVNAKETSGDAWESLFIIAYLIRAVTNKFVIDEEFSMLASVEDSSWYTVSYNSLLRGSLENCKTFANLVGIVKPPQSYPHIAIYSPTHAQFETYDLLVAVYRGSQSEVQWHGYQLKEGANLPTCIAVQNVRSIVIRGRAAKNSNFLRNWEILRRRSTKKFFGISGKNWIPRRWKEL